MFRRKFASLTISDDLIEIAATAIQRSKYRTKNGAPRNAPEGYGDDPTDTDRKYARAALEAVFTHLRGSWS